MTVEVATYVNDLQPVNPTSTDQVSQGDDHLRLIKQVLQNTFLNATRAFTIPATSALSTSSTLVKANGESTIYVATTGGAVTLTLPSLVALDAGWKCHFIKTSSDANPMLIKPASGTINSGGAAGLAQARRCIPGVRSTAIWDGANWFITRTSALPLGCMIDFYGSTLPAGYEWPNGQTLASVTTNYPEWVANFGSSGVVPDVRGYACIPLDNLGGAPAGHLPTTYVTSTTLGAVGGTDHSALVTGNLPAYTPAGSVSVSAALNYGGAIGSGGSCLLLPTGSGSPFAYGGTASGAQGAQPGITASGSFTGTAQGGTSASFSNLQPCIMVGKLLVVE